MELVPPNSKKVTKYTGPTQGPNVGTVFNKQFLSLKTYWFLLQVKMSSLVPWVDRPQPLFDLYLKLDWLVLVGPVYLVNFLLLSGTSSILKTRLAQTVAGWQAACEDRQNF